jgi:cysteine desulfurase
LYVRKGVKIDNLIHGGGQERKKRAGTENTPAIAGFAKACELAIANLETESIKNTKLRDRLIQGILEQIPEVRLNGHPTKRLPGNANVSIRYIEGESILLSLDLIGIAASSGSACTSGALDPSHVLLAIGLTHEIAHGSLRFSIGKYTTDEEVDFVLEKLPTIIQRLRDMSPLYNR